MFTLKQLAHAETEVLIAAPERGDSMAKFLTLASEFFSMENSSDEIFDAIIQEKFIPALPVLTTQTG